MKFEQQLALKTIPSWAIYYLNYKKLKSVLYTDFERTSSGPVLTDSGAGAKEPVGDRSKANGHVPSDTSDYDAFRALFLSEVDKVNTRYVEQESEAREKLTTLKTQWKGGEAAASESSKAEFIKLLRQLENLSDFTQSNITACRKILKKADKVSRQTMTLRLWPLVTNLRFAKSESDEALLHEARAVWRKRAAIPIAPEVAEVTGTLESKMRRLTPAVATVSELDLASFPAGQISRVWVALAEDGMGLPIRVPVIIAKGTVEGPVVGITAALHGNELNGIPLIHRLFDEVSPAKLHGTLVAVPVANSPGFLLSQRGYTDGTDLNRVMPGKPNGSSPQVYAYNLMHRIIRHFEYLLDMHTASRGRVNSLYVRANLLDSRTARMARLQNPQIIVHNTSPDGSLRGAAMQRGIPAITVEIGDPSRFQKRFVRNALIGVTNILSQLRMIPDEANASEFEPVVCTRSFWIFAKSGGILTVHPDVNTWVRSGDVIATIHSVFGDLEEEYFAPQDGIIVGKHVDPVCQSGNRILHLGVVENELPAVVDDGHM
ncbi:hypothetical protein IWW38_000271 [Coemansia aciculifera]|uniref:Uncharacterized protein n=1 Tax=Coemansia aciculifera TaxID=417176 RepID=A0ACC1MA23_9FUNG|nr:hypothetical protein IWW38_000271 [Coemansia aciculifera]